MHLSVKYELVIYYSGLVAAREFSQVFPDLSEKLLIPSSVHNASIKVRILSSM